MLNRKPARSPLQRCQRRSERSCQRMAPPVPLVILKEGQGTHSRSRQMLRARLRLRHETNHLRLSVILVLALFMMASGLLKTWTPRAEAGPPAFVQRAVRRMPLIGPTLSDGGRRAVARLTLARRESSNIVTLRGAGELRMDHDTAMDDPRFVVCSRSRHWNCRCRCPQ